MVRLAKNCSLLRAVLYGEPSNGRHRRVQTCSASGAGKEKGRDNTVSTYQARVRKCGVCNGVGRYYPIDEGPLRECQVCNGHGLLKVKIFRPRSRPRSAGAEIASVGGNSSLKHSRVGGNDDDRSHIEGNPSTSFRSNNHGGRTQSAENKEPEDEEASKR
jgi:hypothetical protein